MVTLYYKSEHNQIQLHNTKDMQVSMLACSHDDSTKLKLYEIKSYLYSEQEIKDKCDWKEYPGTFINKIEAHLLGKELQPDRQIDDLDGKRDYSFSLLDVNEAKEIKISHIANKTVVLIYNGFMYDNHHFGATVVDQLNWNTLLGLSDDQDYPIENEVKDWDSDFYTIKDRQNLIDIIKAGKNIVIGYKASHKILCDLVKTKTTIQDVYDIIDDRK